jgi:hypothetical protein
VKNIKIIAGILITILLGAIGSGIWERFLSPMVDATYRGTVSLISSVYTGYLDSIYVSAARELPDVYQRKIAFLIIIIVASYLIFVSIKHGNWKSPFLNSLGIAASKILPLQGLLLGVVMLAMSYFGLAKASYSQDIKSYSFHSMEILRPYIGESDYLTLKSEYYRIENSSEFQLFNEKIVDKSKEFKVKLPNILLIQ